MGEQSKRNSIVNKGPEGASIPLNNIRRQPTMETKLTVDEINILMYIVIDDITAHPENEERNNELWEKLWDMRKETRKNESRLSTN